MGCSSREDVGLLLRKGCRTVSMETISGEGLVWQPALSSNLHWFIFQRFCAVGVLGLLFVGGEQEDEACQYEQDKDEPGEDKAVAVMRGHVSLEPVGHLLSLVPRRLHKHLV